MKLVDVEPIISAWKTVGFDKKNEAKSFLNSKNFIVYIQGQIRSTIGDVFLDLANIWFDAKKVLPEKDKEVLVKREKFGIEIAFLSYDGLWQEHDEYIVFGDVTHWAHLPEPPKEV